MNLKVKVLVTLEKIVVPLQHFIFLLLEYFYLKPLNSLPQEYDYFPIHFSPESSINTPAPFYIDQIRVIDTIMLNRKNTNRLLLIKEHPAMFGKRPLIFYRNLKKIPYVRFIKTNMNSIELLKKATITYTVTGTVALEAFLLDKKFHILGENFLSKWINENNIIDNDKRLVFINDVLNVSDDFVLYPPSNNLKKNSLLFSEKNIRIFSIHLTKHINLKDKYDSIIKNISE